MRGLTETLSGQRIYHIVFFLAVLLSAFHFITEDFFQALVDLIAALTLSLALYRNNFNFFLIILLGVAILAFGLKGGIFLWTGLFLFLSGSILVAVKDGVSLPKMLRDLEKKAKTYLSRGSKVVIPSIGREAFIGIFVVVQHLILFLGLGILLFLLPFPKLVNGIIYAAVIIIVFLISFFFWKIESGKQGIRIKAIFPFFPLKREYFYEKIDKVQIRGKKVKIICKPIIFSSWWIYLPKRDEFIKTIKRYAPKKLEVVK